MKVKDLKSLRSKSTKDLKKLVEEKRTELLKVKADVKTGSKKNLKAHMNLRKEIAQTLTLIREKEIIESMGESVDGNSVTRKTKVRRSHKKNTKN